MHIPVLFVIWELLRGIFFFQNNPPPPLCQEFFSISSGEPSLAPIFQVFIVNRLWFQFLNSFILFHFFHFSPIPLYFLFSFFFLFFPFFFLFFTFSPFFLTFLPACKDWQLLSALIKGNISIIYFPNLFSNLLSCYLFSFSSFPVFCYFIQENEYITHSILWQTDIIRLCIGKRNYNSYVS